MEAVVSFEPNAVEGRLRESEERYRAVIENASDMIQSCRPDGSFEFVNGAWLSKLGYTADEVQQLRVWDIIHPESMDHCLQTFMQAASGVSIDNVRATFVTKDGRAIPVEGNATSRMVDGQVIATHSFFRDISERLRSQELEQRNAQLEREQAARYLEKMAALGKLSAGLAHELNNPAAAAQRAAAQMREQMDELWTLAMRLAQHGLDENAWLQLQRTGPPASPAPGQQLSLIELADREDDVVAWLEAHGVEDAWRIARGLVAAGWDLGALEPLGAALPEAAIGDALTWLSCSQQTGELVETIASSARSISE